MRQHAVEPISECNMPLGGTVNTARKRFTNPGVADTRLDLRDRATLLGQPLANFLDVSQQFRIGESFLGLAADIQ